MNYRYFIMSLLLLTITIILIGIPESSFAQEEAPRHVTAYPGGVTLRVQAVHTEDSQPFWDKYPGYYDNLHPSGFAKPNIPESDNVPIPMNVLNEIDRFFQEYPLSTMFLGALKNWRTSSGYNSELGLTAANLAFYATHGVGRDKLATNYQSIFDVNQSQYIDPIDAIENEQASTYDEFSSHWSKYVSNGVLDHRQESLPSIEAKKEGDNGSTDYVPYTILRPLLENKIIPNALTGDQTAQGILRATLRNLRSNYLRLVWMQLIRIAHDLKKDLRHYHGGIPAFKDKLTDYAVAPDSSQTQRSFIVALFPSADTVAETAADIPTDLVREPFAERLTDDFQNWWSHYTQQKYANPLLIKRYWMEYFIFANSELVQSLAGMDFWTPAEEIVEANDLNINLFDKLAGYKEPADSTRTALANVHVADVPSEVKARLNAIDNQQLHDILGLDLWDRSIDSLVFVDSEKSYGKSPDIELLDPAASPDEDPLQFNIADQVKKIANVHKFLRAFSNTSLTSDPDFYATLPGIRWYREYDSLYLVSNPGTIRRQTERAKNQLREHKGAKTAFQDYDPDNPFWLLRMAEASIKEQPAVYDYINPYEFAALSAARKAWDAARGADEDYLRSSLPAAYRNII